MGTYSLKINRPNILYVDFIDLLLMQTAKKAQLDMHIDSAKSLHTFVLL